MERETGSGGATGGSTDMALDADVWRPLTGTGEYLVPFHECSHTILTFIFSRDFSAQFFSSYLGRISDRRRRTHF